MSRPLLPAASLRLATWELTEEELKERALLTGYRWPVLQSLEGFRPGELVTLTGLPRRYPRSGMRQQQMLTWVLHGQASAASPKEEQQDDCATCDDALPKKRSDEIRRAWIGFFYTKGSRT